MIKVLTSEQIRRWDQYTIKHEPIRSIDLMERASNAFVDQFLNLFPVKKRVRVFCGVGNNGGDGLAIGRLLKERGWEVLKYIIGNPQKGTEDFKKNLDRSDLYAIIKDEKDLPTLSEEDIVIDGIFGSGLSRPLQGLFEKVVNHINDSDATIVAIDVASGVFLDEPMTEDPIAIKPHYTVSFQSPKLPFLLPDSYPFVGEWAVVDIGLKAGFLEQEPADLYFSQSSDMQVLMPVRKKFTHKTEVGKLLIVAGSKGKMGAAVLCTRAAFACGAGLINVCIPACGTDIVQVAVPEAMVIEDPEDQVISKIPKTEECIVIGPGLGLEPVTLRAFESFLKKTDHPIVIDADGLNLLAKKQSLLKLLPKESILTPHPGEFKRLVGPWKNDFERLRKLRDFSTKYQINVVLKGAYSTVVNSAGKVFFNPTGNPALATAGSGDVLAGIIGSFLAQRLAPIDALKLGVFLHGLAGDLAVSAFGIESITASQIIEFLSPAQKFLLEKRSLD